MTLAMLMDRSAMILHHDTSVGTDDYNAPTFADADESVAVYIEQLSRTEDTVERGTGVATHLCVMPATAHPHLGCELLLDGVRYEIVGPINQVMNPRIHVLSHLEALLAEVQ
jgi:hypothetical protein